MWICESTISIESLPLEKSCIVECHSCESGNPGSSLTPGPPASAGVTAECCRRCVLARLRESAFDEDGWGPGRRAAFDPFAAAAVDIALAAPRRGLAGSAT